MVQKEDSECLKAKTTTESDGDATREVLRDLKDFYLSKVLPVEEITNFSRYGFGPLNEGDFESPPLILLMGPYSAGKTTFVEHLIGQTFPGQNIGPEPTTDKFCAIMHGTEERVMPGNALTVTPGTPFHGLQKFGNNFLARFEGSFVPNNEMLRNLTIIDTPGVLSGKKQTNGRSYDYAKCLDWFVERSDMIILLFDVQKLDISDEMGLAIKGLEKHSDKIRVVLNKSDSISHQHLMKVYGALLWSLGRIITTPEVTRVYIGSFWSEPLKNPDTECLLKAEMAGLMKDLSILPRMGAVRKINDMVKRIRQVIVHAILLDHLKAEMPSVFGKEKKKKDLLDNLPTVFRTVMNDHDLAFGDFPDIEKFRNGMEGLDFSKLPKIKGDRMRKGKRLYELSRSLKVTIPGLLGRLPGIDSMSSEVEDITS